MKEMERTKNERTMSSTPFVTFIIGAMIGTTGTLGYQMVFERVNAATCKCDVDEIRDYSWINTASIPTENHSSSYAEPKLATSIHNLQKTMKAADSENSTLLQQPWTYKCRNHPRITQRHRIFHPIQNCDFEATDYQTYLSIQVHSQCSSLFQQLWTPSKVFNEYMLLDGVSNFKIVDGEPTVLSMANSKKHIRKMSQVRVVSNPFSPPRLNQRVELTLLQFNPGQYMVMQIDTNSPEAPYGSMFIVRERWDFIDAQAKCKVRWAGTVKWNTWTIFHGAIESETASASESAAEKWKAAFANNGFIFDELLIPE